MSAVSNPYIFNIEKDYNSRAEITVNFSVYTMKTDIDSHGDLEYIGYIDRSSSAGSISPTTYNGIKIGGIYTFRKDSKYKSNNLLFVNDPGYVYVYVDDQLYYAGTLKQDVGGWYHSSNCYFRISSGKTYTVKISNKALK